MTEKIRQCSNTIIELMILTIIVIIITNAFAHLLWLEKKIDFINKNIIWRQLIR